jgi:serine/threonine protein kinase
LFDIRNCLFCYFLGPDDRDLAMSGHLTRNEGQGAELPAVPGYEILDELGRGGMGVVYRAMQVGLKRVVALKLIRDAALASAQDRGRLRIEAEAVARMSHPNIVQIYDVGEFRGLPYLAMELVEGGSLEQHLAGRPLPPTEAARITRALAVAVEHAHSRQIVHRDLKPANVLLLKKSETRFPLPVPLPVPGQGTGSGSGMGTAADADLDFEFRIADFEPKITDFGLAKRLNSESTGWTQEGAVLGTANYMAPEQAAGRTRDIGPAVDIYALGAILYQLLTGLPPFQGDSWNETLQRVLFDEPMPPARLQADVPRDLETICLKCLEKQPDRRYARAADLADDLSRFLEGKVVSAIPLSEMERLKRLAARDGYEVLGEIGRGPRSIVYHALSGALHQPAALKIFSARACTREEWEARIQRSADLWITLTHPQIVTIQKAGWWDGAPYLAVEYMPQGSLANLGRERSSNSKPLTVPNALRLVEQVAEIVSYLHRQGAVHGNLKPSNVLMAAGGIPRIADFFLSGGLFLGPFFTEDDPSRTQPHNVSGYEYLAPELIRDAGAEPRPFTDIYGLGLILYELLTGRPPFAGLNARETLDCVRLHDPVPPSQLNPEVTPRVEALCLRSLRKNPWHRYQRVYNFINRLRFLQENPEAHG